MFPTSYPLHSHLSCYLFTQISRSALIYFMSLVWVSPYQLHETSVSYPVTLLLTGQNQFFRLALQLTSNSTRLAVLIHKVSTLTANLLLYNPHSPISILPSALQMTMCPKLNVPSALLKNPSELPSMACPTHASHVS